MKINSNFSIHKHGFMGQSCSFTYISSMAAFMQQQQS